MDRPSNQVLREFSDNARRASKENQPPQAKTLASPIVFNPRGSYKKKMEHREPATDSRKFPARMILNEPISEKREVLEGAADHNGLAAIHPAFGPQQRPPPGRARAATPLDLKIGSAEATDCLPQRLRPCKSNPVMLRQRLEKLIRENGYLQQELLYHKDTLAVMNSFFELARRAHHDLQNALAETARRVAISEQRMLDCYGRQPIHGASEDNVF